MKSLPHEHRKRWLLLVEEFADKLETMNTTDYKRTGNLEGFRRGVARQDQLFFSRMESLDKQFTEIEAVIDLLEERKGAWEVQDAQFVFDDDKDAQRFNDHFIAMEGLAARGEDLMRRNLEESKELLHELIPEVFR